MTAKMIKRTLYFGSNAYIRTEKKQLILEYPDKTKPKAYVPIEDIGVVVLDAPQLTASRALFASMLENNVAVIICNEKHMPQGMLLNLDSNSIQQELFRNQVSASDALKNKLWQQTVKAKILNQAGILKQIGQNYKELIFWSDKVNKGDPENIEGRAALHYWKHLFQNIIPKFKRERFGEEPNNLLNYGYAILRAVVARSLSGSGLLPTLGIHHKNKYNAYTLADDIMEPYRPYVDALVRDLTEKYYDSNELYNNLELTTQIKTELLKIPVLDVKIKDKTHPLSVAVRHTTASLSACFAKTMKNIKYPIYNS